MNILDLHNSGAHSLRISGVRIEFNELGICRDATPEQLEAVDLTPLRRERFEVRDDGPRRHRRRDAAPPENAPSITAPPEQPVAEEPSAE